MSVQDVWTEVGGSPRRFPGETGDRRIFSTVVFSVVTRDPTKEDTRKEKKKKRNIFLIKQTDHLLVIL